MTICTSRWHTTVSKIALPDKIVLRQTHSLQSLVLLLVLAHPLIRVCAPHHNSYPHHALTCLHTQRWPRQYLPVMSWFVMAPPLDLNHKTVLDWIWVLVGWFSFTCVPWPLEWREGGFLTKCQKSSDGTQRTRWTLETRSCCLTC